MTSDVLRPFDDLLGDRDFWREYETSIVRNVVPLFFEIFVAGAIAGTTVAGKTKAFPSELPDALSPEEIAALAEEAIRDYVPEFTKNISRTTYEQVRSAVTNARANGTGVEGVIRDILPLFSRSRAELIGVTETTRLFGIGAQASYKLQGFNAWQWHSVNDPWVDPVCGGLNDQIFPMDKLFEPAHPRCRCFPSPVHIEEKKPVEVPPEPVPADGRPGTKYPDDGFKTRAEAEKWTRERFPHLEVVDFSGAHIVNLNPTLRAFDRLTDTYPEVTARLRNITTRPSRIPRMSRFSSGTMAYATNNGTTIALNPKFFGDEKFKVRVYDMTQPRMARRFLSKTSLEYETVSTVEWHPAGTGFVSSVFIHEYGHQVSNWLQSFPVDDPRRAVFARLNADHMGPAQVANLSGYAMYSRGEAFAEAFSQMDLALRDQWHPSTQALHEALTSIVERE